MAHITNSNPVACKRPWRRRVCSCRGVAEFRGPPCHLGFKDFGTRPPASKTPSSVWNPGRISLAHAWACYRRVLILISPPGMHAGLVAPVPVLAGPSHGCGPWWIFAHIARQNKQQGWRGMPPGTRRGACACAWCGPTGGSRKARATSPDPPLASSAPPKGYFGQGPKEGNPNTTAPMRSWNLQKAVPGMASLMWVVGHREMAQDHPPGD